MITFLSSLFIFLFASPLPCRPPNQVTFLPLPCFFNLRLFLFSSLLLLLLLQSPLPHPLFFSLSLSLLLIHFLSLAGDRSYCQRRATKPVVSKSCVFPAAHRSLCVCICVHGAHCWTQDSRVICFPVTACDPKNREWSPVDCWPGACCRQRGKSWHHQTVWQQRPDKGRKIIVKCFPSRKTYYWWQRYFMLDVKFKELVSDLSKMFLFSFRPDIY